MTSFFFYLFALTLILSSLAVILSRNPLYNVLSLVAATFSLSNLFILLEAYFVGIILLLVYAGAVLIFFLFVVMCLNLNTQTLTTEKHSRFRILGWLLGTTFLAGFFLATKSYLLSRSLEPSTIRGTIETVGKILFTEYTLPFELTSFLLLIATFGIVSLAKGALKTN
jgi:NADH-quinone oxidoreductase subunit J